MNEYPPINEVALDILEGARYPPTPGKYAGDIGLDIRADIPETWRIWPYRGRFIPGGFRLQFSRGWAGMVVGRSSMNRLGLHVFTGIIDNGFTGQIGAEVRNLTQDPIMIEPGQRIAQLVLVAAFRPTPNEVVGFRESDRGENGFGSTG